MAEKKLYGLLAEYDSPGALIDAAEKVRDAGYKNWDCHSSFPVHGLDPAMGIRMTILPLLVFGAGLAGCAGGMVLQWWANAFQWPWIISGKPFFSLPAQIPIIFECTILLSAFGAFFGQWGLNKLPQVWHPLFGNDNFLKATDDGFFVAIEADDPNFDRAKTEALLKEAGATSVEACEYETSKEHRKLPKGILAFIVLSTLLAIVPLAFVLTARGGKSAEPHFHIIPNMDFQPKFRAQSDGSDELPELFADGAISRLAPEGTVARGDLRADGHLYRGIVAVQAADGTVTQKWAETFPSRIELTEETMNRGEKMFGIYCRPCHGDTGGAVPTGGQPIDGLGMINKRAQDIQASQTGWNVPKNLTEIGIIEQPHGQLFNTISYGVNTMAGYASQIDVEDRWALVLYLRALQRSRVTPLSDAPKGTPLR